MYLVFFAQKTQLPGAKIKREARANFSPATTFAQEHAGTKFILRDFNESRGKKKQREIRRIKYSRRGFSRGFP